MVQDTGNEIVRHFGQALLPVRIIENIFSRPEQGHVGVHAVARLSVDGLRHKGRVQAVALGQRLDRQLEGHDIVRGVESAGVFKVDLVLPHGALMMAGLDLISHLLQRKADLPAGAFAVVQGAQIEVAGLVVGLGGGLPLLIGLEQEKLTLRPHVECVVSHVGRLFQRPLQYTSGIADKGRAIGIVDIADQAGHFTILRLPGKNDKGI